MTERGEQRVAHPDPTDIPVQGSKIMNADSNHECR
jgi:hypothetical protein